MMTVLEGILLGMFQGFTEFLPISSSGHLVLLQELMSIKSPGVFIEVSLHFGTLLSILIVFRNDIYNLIIEFLKILKGIFFPKNLKKTEYTVFVYMIIMGSIPTAIMGIFFEPLFKSAYESSFFVSLMLLITGLLLWYSDRFSGNKTVKEMSILDAIFIGFFQGLAINPGLSRSGSTIFASLFRGMNKESATRFSFILSIPAVLGAFLFELKDILKVNIEHNISFLSVFCGVISAFISGYIAINILINLLKRKKLHYFSYYCWVLGAIIILLKML